MPEIVDSFLYLITAAVYKFKNARIPDPDTTIINAIVENFILTVSGKKNIPKRATDIARKDIVKSAILKTKTNGFMKLFL